MLELTNFQKEISTLILNTLLPGKHCARSAIFNLQKAWEIKEVDPGMATFRSITAQEESSTAIIHSLKRRNYKGAKKLSHRNHIHKTAALPFIQAVSRVFVLMKDEYKPEYVIDKKQKLKIRVTVKQKNSKPSYGYPDPPLNFNLSVNGKTYDFSHELKEIANQKNTITIISYIRRLANMRNRILYASPEGIPKISSSIERFIKRKRDVVFALLITYLLIDQYKEQQLFVQQALDAFMKMLEIIPNDIVFE